MELQLHAAGETSLQMTSAAGGGRVLRLGLLAMVCAPGDKPTTGQESSVVWSASVALQALTAIQLTQRI